MKIFISWSGDKSRAVALALRDWLPGVINSVQPFVSAKDIYAGSRWQTDIATELDATNFGIVCITTENQAAPWLNFEAGALAKAVDSSRVVPLAVDLKPSDVQLPLGQFQAQPATERGIREILTSINSACESSLPDALLDKAFSVWWPELERTLKEINEKSAPSGAPVRSERELLEETLNTVRSLARTIGRGVAVGEPVPDDHPLKGELSALLKEHGFESSRILHATGLRKLGIRVTKRIPPEVREKILERAAPYGIEIDFLGPMRLTSGRGTRTETTPTSEGAEEA